MSDLTNSQRATLDALLFHPRTTARQIGVRSDVLWRLEERGLVSRNIHEQWSITARGREVLDFHG